MPNMSGFCMPTFYYPENKTKGVIIMEFKKGDILKHCKGFEVLIIGKVGSYMLYSKEIENGLYEGVDFWIRPIDMFYDNHTSGVPIFELIESLTEEKIKYIDKYNEYKRYEIARHSETLEYYVIDLINNNIITKI